jgi:hypothetical protein
MTWLASSLWTTSAAINNFRMNTMSTDSTKDHYEFFDTDFREDAHGDARVEPGMIDDEALNDAPPLSSDEPERVAHANAKPEKDNSKMLIISVIGVAVLTVSGLGWFGYNMIAPQQRSPIAEQQMRNPTSEFAAVKPAMPVRESSQIAPVQLSNEQAVEPQLTAQPSIQPNESAGGPDLQAVVTRDGQQEPDDTFYDNIAKAAESNDVDRKPAAVASQTSPLVQSQAPTAADVAISAEQNAQIANLAAQITKQSAENANVLDAVRALSKDFTAMRAKLDANDEATKQLGQRVNDLGSTVETYQKTTQSKIDAAIKSAAESIAASGKTKKLVLVGGPIEPTEPTRPVRRQEPRREPKSLSEPAASLAITEAVKPQRVAAIGTQASGPAACQANTVSQNWKVKGVSTGAAYVRREDGEALLLRLDSEVPGFGRVKSFDPNTRTVCTTSGLIGR